MILARDTAEAAMLDAVVAVLVVFVLPTVFMMLVVAVALPGRFVSED